MPNDADNLGRALSRRILEWMDICETIAGRRLAKRQMVVASMNHVDFLAPIGAGDVVTVETYVLDVGHTSTDIKMDVTVERLNEGDRRETPTSFFTFVALDDDGEPVPVPDLVCDSQKEHELHDTAFQKRREHRAVLTEKFE